MSLESTLDELAGPMEALFSLIEEFDDITYRYLDLHNAVFRSASEEEMVDLISEMFLGKAYLDTLRLNARLPRALLERARGMDWYKGDMEALSRHTSLMALMPEATDSEKVPTAAGELTSRLLGERKTLSHHYPHLYSPQALGVPADIGEDDRYDLHDEVHALEMEHTGLAEEEWEELEMKRELVETAIMAIQEVDPLLAEEALDVWNRVRHACEVIVSENGPNVRKEVAEMIRENDPVVQSVLTRFVLESMMFRLLLEDRAEDLEEMFERWLGEDRAARDELMPLTREEADRSLDLMEQLFSEPLTAYMKMMRAAMYMAEAEGESSWNMVQAVLSRCEEADYWPELALKGVLIQISSGKGGQEGLAQAILARGERNGSPGTIAAGLVALAMALHSLGRLDDAAKHHRRMMDALIAGRGDPDVLAVYPLAANISIQMGDRKSVRKLAGAGLRAMEDLPELDEQREQLLELRRSVDRVDKERGKVSTEGPGKGPHNRKRGR